MPELSGLEATRIIRRRFAGRGPLIVGLSGYASNDARHECLAAGMNDYLVKPVTLAQFADGDRAAHRGDVARRLARSLGRARRARRRTGRYPPRDLSSNSTSVPAARPALRIASAGSGARTVNTTISLSVPTDCALWRS